MMLPEALKCKGMLMCSPWRPPPPTPFPLLLVMQGLGVLFKNKDSKSASVQGDDNASRDKNRTPGSPHGESVLHTRHDCSSASSRTSPFGDFCVSLHGNRDRILRGNQSKTGMGSRNRHRGPCEGWENGGDGNSPEPLEPGLIHPTGSEEAT